ncbi:MAG: helix-turn-helix domain-containing protein [Smithellaceae bacterium]
MENKFAKLNYYEMLDLKPDATLFEIRHAYNVAQQLYQTDSLISYSFFAPDERKAILDLLENAYLTLINEKKRQDYDNELIRLGLLNETVKKTTVKIPVSIFDINRAPGKPTAVKNAAVTLRAKVMENKFISEILSQEAVSGADLGKIRHELAVPLEHIAQETKIRIDFLLGIEGDNTKALPAEVFLKGFIKAYLKCLCLEPVDEICRKYLSNPAFCKEKA